MEALQIINNEKESLSNDKPFIVANTSPVDFIDLKVNHIIPVYIKDNEPVISHAEFIDITSEVAHHVFQREIILNPSIRVSHPIKGRIPDAKEKPAIQLLEHEKTIYYERMAFAIEIPSIRDTVAGNNLCLTIGGVKSYHLDNLYSRKGGDEHFKIFIGFQNKVCMNMCIWTDGYIADLRVKNTNQLMDGIYNLLTNYNAQMHLESLKQLTQFSITEDQFAHVIGKCRMYQHLSLNERVGLQELSFGDTQIGQVVKDYYKDDSFGRQGNGEIDLWSLYNLFTGSNKTSYIDTFLCRGKNAFEFTSALIPPLQNKKSNWFIN